VSLQCGFKVDATREILTVVMMSYYKNVCSCKRQTVVLFFGDLLCSFLRLTTMSLHTSSKKSVTKLVKQVFNYILLICQQCNMKQQQFTKKLAAKSVKKQQQFTKAITETVHFNCHILYFYHVFALT